MPRAMPKFTKTPPELVAAFEAAVPDDPRVVRKTMFGYPAYFLNGNMFAFTFGPRIAVRVDEARRAKLGHAGAAFEIMPGRAMKEYVAVPASATKGAALERWIGEGLAAADRLPAKTAAKKTTAKKMSRAR
ncbi:MAG TPA: TfoX/Sxy family protein [Candidatus Limnocylindria bacterium]